MSQNLLDDALTIAIIESGVALRAFDADRVDGPPRDPADDERRGRSRADPGELPAGTLVIADDERPLALLFGALGRGPRRRPEDRRERCSPRSRSRACRRSPSRRRSGSPLSVHRDADARRWIASSAAIRLRVRRQRVGRSSVLNALEQANVAAPQSRDRRSREPVDAAPSAVPATICGARSRGSSASSASSSRRRSRAPGSSGASARVGGPRVLSARRARAGPRRPRAPAPRRPGRARAAGPRSRRQTVACSSR